MGNIWTVKPTTDTYDLVWQSADGPKPFWIKLKSRLTVGEERKITTAGWQGIRQSDGVEAAAGATPEVRIDWQSQSFARTEVYLVDWSFEDDDHKKLPLLRATLESLDPDLFLVIENSISAHIERKAQEKKLPSGTTSPVLTSV